MRRILDFSISNCRVTLELLNYTFSQAEVYSSTAFWKSHLLSFYVPESIYELINIHYKMLSLDFFYAFQLNTTFKYTYIQFQSRFVLRRNAYIRIWIIVNCHRKEWHVVTLKNNKWPYQVDIPALTLSGLQKYLNRVQQPNVF